MGKNLIQETIRNRTFKGQFARTGSSGTRARRYNPQYARRIGKSAGGPVDLFRSGQLHGSIRGRGRVNKMSVTARAEIVGSKARQKWKWLEVEGAGKSRIKRRFMYLTVKEAKMISRKMIKAGMLI